MKKTLKQTLNEALSISNSMPRTINEAIDFNAGQMPQETAMPAANAPMEGGEEGMEAPLPGAHPENVAPEARAHAAQLIDSIRKQALRAMADLADDPECEEYIMLKKVWQMTDRKPEKDGEKNA